MRTAPSNVQRCAIWPAGSAPGELLLVRHWGLSSNPPVSRIVRAAHAAVNVFSSPSSTCDHISPPCAESSGRLDQRRRPTLGPQRVHVRVAGQHVVAAQAVALAVESVSAAHAERETSDPSAVDDSHVRVVELVPSQSLADGIERVVLRPFRAPRSRVPAASSGRRRPRAGRPPWGTASRS